MACELTLEGGVITAAVVMNELRRLTAPPRPAELSLPEQLVCRSSRWPIAVVMTICVEAGMSIDRLSQLKPCASMAWRRRGRNCWPRDRVCRCSRKRG